MEYTIDSFVARIRDNLYDNFPYEDNAISTKKHKKRPLHIRDVAFKNLPVTVNIDTRIFDIGSEYAEIVYPYYHILQDAEVIHKRGRGTSKSKGSQDDIKTLSERDYNKVSYNGKTYSQEYKKNTRGKGTTFVYGRNAKATRYYDGSKWNYGVQTWSVKGSKRSRVDKAQRIVIGSDGNRYVINANANYYKNIHYHYIDRILDQTLPWVASEFGMKIKRTEITTLEDENSMQQSENIANMIDILNSFGEEDYD